MIRFGRGSQIENSSIRGGDGADGGGRGGGRIESADAIDRARAAPLTGSG